MPIKNSPDIGENFTIDPYDFARMLEFPYHFADFVQVVVSYVDCLVLDLVAQGEHLLLGQYFSAQNRYPLQNFVELGEKSDLMKKQYCFPQEALHQKYDSDQSCCENLEKFVHYFLQRTRLQSQ